MRVGRDALPGAAAARAVGRRRFAGRCPGRVGALAHGVSVSIEKRFPYASEGIRSVGSSGGRFRGGSSADLWERRLAWPSSFSVGMQPVAKEGVAAARGPRGVHDP